MKQQRYVELVRQRKLHDYNEPDILNPSQIQFGRYDCDQINAWAQWHNDLDAEIMLIGQDFGDENYFITNQGKDDINNPTNLNLRMLFKEAGIDIGTTDKPNNEVKLYFTNAVLGMKRNKGGMASKVKGKWYFSTCDSLIRPLINLIEPKILITLGTVPYKVICRIYKLKCLPLRQIIESNPILLYDGTMLFAFYHCSGLGLANRNLEKQKNDWSKIRSVRTPTLFYQAAKEL